jgi:hypothetical protein
MIPGEVECLCRQGETGARVCDDILHSEEHVFPDGEELVPVPSEGMHPDIHLQRRRPDAGQSYAYRVTVDHRVSVCQFSQPDEDVAQLIGAGLMAQRDRRLDQHLVAVRPVDQLLVDERGVGDGNEGPVTPPDLGRTQADPLDGPMLVTERAVIADADGTVEVEHHAGDEVFERRPDAQGDRQATDAETCRHTVHRQTKIVGPGCQDDHTAHQRRGLRGDQDDRVPHGISFCPRLYQPLRHCHNEPPEGHRGGQECGRGEHDVQYGPE